ncbi:hypothetical protein [Streptomyces sp. NPDC059003]|uniref:hypothetical protein n=1 Tax=Streptomyces sp. NPDC059003 TaxID=3346691 RepID=UPI0036B691E1
MEQTVKGQGSNAPDWTFTSRSQEFTVGAPRYSLTSADVLASFPAPGSTAPAGHLLPYVSLRDPYLPWERPGQAPAGWDKAPTMAVLVLADGETAGMAPASGEAADLLTKDLGGALAPKVATPRPGNQCTVIDVLVEDLRDRLLPDPLNNLPLLTHVRREVRQDAENKGTPLRAHSAVISSRFPRAVPDPAAPASRDKDRSCHYTAHLISLLGHEKNLTDQSLDPKKKLRLVSLWSWSFLTPAGDVKTYADAFDRMLANQKCAHQGDRLRYTPPTSAPAAVKERMRAGYLPISHRLATGERTASWYRGPFGPWPPPQSAPVPAHRPFSSADEALIYSTAECAFDISLAAAWNIGYQLVLSRGDLFGQLLTLKHDAQKRLMSLVKATGPTAVTEYPADSPSVPQAVVAAALDPVPLHRRFDAMMTGDRDKRTEPLGIDITTALRDTSAGGASAAPPAAPQKAQAHLAEGRLSEALQEADVPRTYGERPLVEHTAALLSHPGVSRDLKSVLRQRHLPAPDVPPLAEPPGVPASATVEFTPRDPGPGGVSAGAEETWLWDTIDLLMVLPICYLLPFTDAVLPTDSARFFSVDERWLSAFADGMLAVGSHTSVDRLLEPLVADVVFKPRDSARAPACGLIIRSEIIRAWPALPLPEPAAGDALATTTDPGFFTVQGAKLVARTQIGSDTALLLFDKRPDAILLREPGHVMEFGLDNGDGKKETRNTNGTAHQVDVYGEFLRDTPGKPGRPWPGHLPESLDVQGLARRIGCVGKPAEFAFQMLNLPATLTITPPPLT